MATATYVILTTKTFSRSNCIERHMESEKIVGEGERNTTNSLSNKNALLIMRMKENLT